MTELIVLGIIIVIAIIATLTEHKNKAVRGASKGALGIGCGLFVVIVWAGVAGFIILLISAMVD